MFCESENSRFCSLRVLIRLLVLRPPLKCTHHVSKLRFHLRNFRSRRTIDEASSMHINSFCQVLFGVSLLLHKQFLLLHFQTSDSGRRGCILWRGVLSESAETFISRARGGELSFPGFNGDGLWVHTRVEVRCFFFCFFFCREVNISAC